MTTTTAEYDDPRDTIPEDNVAVRTLVSRSVAKEIDEHGWRRGVTREGFIYLAILNYIDFLNDHQRKD